MNHNELGTKPHYQILDGLRGVAAIIVVFFHLAEPLAGGHADNVVNHGYLAVDFFFLLSGFVIGYAYDDRWGKLTIGGFLRRRLERLQPLVVLGMTLGALGFYFTDSTLWPLIHTVPVWKLIVVMLIGYTILPIPLSMDIRGWAHYVLVYFYVACVSNHKGITLGQAWPYALLTFSGAIALAYASLNLYDEPVRAWLRKKTEVAKRKVYYSLIPQ